MSRNLIETVVGAVVLAVAVGFAAVAVQNTHVKTDGTYPIQAKFDMVDGIAVGSDVRIGGIKVGVVQKMELDTRSFRALVTLGLNKSVNIPSDSTAAIVSEGLLGNKYVSLTPGGADELMSANDEIMFTQSSVNIETLIGQFMFGGDDGDKSSDGTGAGSASAGASDIDFGL